ncbi:hypothetical protein JCM8097_000662 [Rhodosporidiobolus ruineniae]
MLASALLVAAAAAVPALAGNSKILIPLYNSDESCWPDLQEAATANAGLVDFIAIMNPQDGPGSNDVTNPSLYCIPVLRRAIPGITLLGYVTTGRDADVPSDLADYTSWSNLTVSQGNVTGTAELDGIFFDEVPSFEEPGNDIATWVGYADSARQAFNGNATVMYNPGIFANNTDYLQLYTAGEYVVVYEDTWANFQNATLPEDPVYQAHSVVMISNFPADGATTTLQSTTGELDTYGAQFITNLDIGTTDIYGQFGSDWRSFVSSVAAWPKDDGFPTPIGPLSATSSSAASTTSSGTSSAPSSARTASAVTSGPSSTPTSGASALKAAGLTVAAVAVAGALLA